MSKGAQDGDVQTVRITAWTYAIYCMTSVPILVLTGPDPRPSAVPVLVACAAFAAGLLTILRGDRLGYYCCFVLSLLILPAVPIGTVLGWNMLRALRRSRGKLLRSRWRSIKQQE
jgi:hypothetical protein